MVAKSLLFAVTLAIAGFAQAAPVLKRDGCSSYVIIDTRGTGELQGPSAGFRTMNSKILSSVSGGSEYDTVYPADASQNSAQGTQNIINTINTKLSQNPNTCFVLEGYSQGAAATDNALSKITGAAFDAVKAVILIGDPEHKPGLACNVDGNGGKTTANSRGIEAGIGGGVPDNWVSKTLDICIQGDGVCDSSGGFGITPQHLQYPNNANVQSMGANFAIKALQNGGSGSSSGGSSSGSDGSGSSGGSSDGSGSSGGSSDGSGSSGGSSGGSDSSSGSNGSGSSGGSSGTNPFGSFGGLGGSGGSSPFGGFGGLGGSGGSSPFGGFGGLGGSSGSSPFSGLGGSGSSIPSFGSFGGGSSIPSFGSFGR